MGGLKAVSRIAYSIKKPKPFLVSSPTNMKVKCSNIARKVFKNHQRTFFDGPTPGQLSLLLTLKGVATTVENSVIQFVRNLTFACCLNASMYS